MSREGALWIGGLEGYMDESFLSNAIRASGEEGLVSVKVIKNKVTNEPATYGFINFDSDHNALLAMHRLNGKLIPNSNPPARYKLNHNSTRLGPGERDFSIWVGDLTPEVDDLQLYQFFSARYQSVKTCKVVQDGSGYSKGYGFIRFSDEREQQSALVNMMGSMGLGGKPLKVSIAVPKAKMDRDFGSSSGGGGGGGSSSTPAVAPSDSSAEYSQYWQNQYSQYWSQYAAWSQYSQYYDQQSSYYSQQESAATNNEELKPTKDKSNSNIMEKDIFDGEDWELVDHSAKLDYDKMNGHFLKKSEELWNALESSFWSQEHE